MAELTHFDTKGNAHMVDVSDKNITQRTAIAKARVRMRAQTADLIIQGNVPKGDVLAVARLAGIMAAKKTSDLIPLCHPLALSSVCVDLDVDTTLPGVEITATVKTSGQTGVEMEALTAVSTAALTLYDMLKSAEKTIVIEAIHLAFKDGGKSGPFTP